MLIPNSKIADFRKTFFSHKNEFLLENARFGLVTFLVPLHHLQNHALLLLFLLQGGCAALMARSMRASSDNSAGDTPGKGGDTPGKGGDAPGKGDTSGKSSVVRDAASKEGEGRVEGGGGDGGVRWEFLVLMEWVGRCGYFSLGNRLLQLYPGFGVCLMLRSCARTKQWNLQSKSHVFPGTNLIHCKNKELRLHRAREI